MARAQKAKSIIEARVRTSDSAVFMREDFADVVGYRQVGRILNDLQNEGKLARVGQGAYARIIISPLTGNIITDGALPDLARELAERIGAKVRPTRAERAYAERRSTQVPMGRVIGINKRSTRELS